MRHKKWVWLAYAAVGLVLSACGGDDSTTGPVYSGGGASGKAGSAGLAGSAGQAGKAGSAGAAGKGGAGGAAGTGGVAGTAGSSKIDKDKDGFDQSVDCNDNDPNVNPKAVEACNGTDDNCNNEIDEGVSKTFYADQDGDFYGVDNAASNLTACTAPAGYASKAGDCNDSNKAVNPGAPEICNSIDDNCDGQIDETGKTTWYLDPDGDGYGVDDPTTNEVGCGQPTGYASKAGDCNETDATINPGATEIAGNSLDENCDGTAQPCPVGLIECNGNVERHCDNNGLWSAQQDCGTQICSTVFGCVVCLPGTATCNGNTSHVCLGDGTGYVDYACDPVVGSNCDPGTGMCSGPCAPNLLGKSYIGCEYYATVTVNSQLQDNAWIPSYTGHFAVVVSNTTAQVATVTITQGGANVLAPQTVAADSAAVIILPWNELRTSTTTQLFSARAYRIRSTQPVTVYQFNPLEYTNGQGANTYTNDASLLLPVTAWNVQYMVAARNSWQYSSGVLHGFYAVVASQSGTSISLAPSATGGNVIAGAGVQSNGTGTISLNEGDVLQVQSANTAAADLTGTVVTADKPVEVIGGHDCTFIPATVGYCDHIEESMFPISTLSTEYVVSAPSVPGQAQPGNAFTRVIAVEASTSLTYDPPNGAWPGTIAQAGSYIEINNNAAFRVTADKKVLVSQYMQGNGDSTVPGDPAMALAVTTPQFRKDYLFHAPTNYDNNYVNVIAPAAASVLLDGAPVGSWTPIGATGLSVARVPLGDNGNGNHRLTSDLGAGITIYGYGVDTSYWYPGGLNLSDM